MYYKLGIEPSSKKWEGYENLSALSLWIDNMEMSCGKLFKNPSLLKEAENIEYTTLREGNIPDVNSIGADFIVFNSLITDVHLLSDEDSGANLITVKNRETNNKYFLLNNYISIDCVDWELSEIDRWPEDKKIASWQNKRGRFFIRPVLIKNKIPPKLKVFRLEEWGSAFNIVISEDYKNQIMNLDFDHSFLKFTLLELV